MGCTDPQALNFDENASENDGTCVYQETNYVLTLIAELPQELKECSGSEMANSHLWVHNDGGNENEIYRIDSLTGEILQTVVIANAQNEDWEDVAKSENYFYIGDFGNNSGNRTDLRIYRINKNDLSNDLISAQFINFNFSDQVDFSENNNNHDFDCEAFFYYNGQLHLFSKNWVDNQTRHYILSAEPGTHTAQLTETFDVGGLITSANISDNNEVVLLGYTELGFNFMWLLFDFDGDDFFSGNKRKILLGNGFTNSQTEGITFRENGYGYIVSEQFKVNDQITLPQKMLSFSINQWTNGTTSIQDISILEMINIYPNPVKNSFEVKNPNQNKIVWKLYNELGQLLKNGKTSESETNIDVSHLSDGIYYFSVTVGVSQKSFQLFKK